MESKDLIECIDQFYDRLKLVVDIVRINRELQAFKERYDQIHKALEKGEITDGILNNLYNRRTYPDQNSM